MRQSVSIDKQSQHEHHAATVTASTNWYGLQVRLVSTKSLPVQQPTITSAKTCGASRWQPVQNYVGSILTATVQSATSVASKQC